MAKIIAYSYPEVVEVALEVELYRSDDADDAPVAMVSAITGGQRLPIPLDADQADELAREIAAVAAELHALEVQQ